MKHTRRPYWLAFVFALFLAGQIAGSMHWHDGELPVDGGCALCTLSSATTAAFTAGGWSPAVILIAALVVFHLCAAPLRRNARFHDSRAPPF